MFLLFIYYLNLRNNTLFLFLSLFFYRSLSFKIFRRYYNSYFITIYYYLSTLLFIDVINYR